MESDLASIAARIESNPLGRLMYGQRELFHSNLIAWFFDALPAAADAVFLPLSRDGAGSRRRVERERENLDLVFHWPDRAPLVVENKVFSVPTRSQLDDYSGKVAGWGAQPSKVLLAPNRPSFDLGDWAYLGYGQLADAILAATGDDPSYESETMRRYAALARDLDTLVSTIDVRSDTEAVWLEESTLAAISSSQMRAALQKSRAERVARVINDALPGLEQLAGSGMSRATPLVESFEYVHTQGMHVHLGWQLQGNQFRRAVVYHDVSIGGHDADSRQKREDISRKHPEFFRFPDRLPQVADGRKEFGHFAPNFVYRYVKTPRLMIADLREVATSVHDDVTQLRTIGGDVRPAGAVRVAPSAT